MRGKRRHWRCSNGRLAGRKVKNEMQDAIAGNKSASETGFWGLRGSGPRLLEGRGERRPTSLAPWLRGNKHCSKCRLLASNYCQYPSTGIPARPPSGTFIRQVCWSRFKQSVLFPLDFLESTLKDLQGYLVPLFHIMYFGF